MTPEIEAGDAVAPTATHRWRPPRGWSAMTVKAEGHAQPLAPGSEQEFITEHYWGYAAQPDGETVEYQVTHPSWQVWEQNSPVRLKNSTGSNSPAYCVGHRHPRSWRRDRP